jgi:hypothetical protein
MSPDSVQAYAKHLADLDADVAEVAVERCVATCKFLPSIAELREQAAVCLDNAPGAEEAWGIVCAEIRRVGYNGRPLFPHLRILEAVNAAGGWYDICASQNAAADRAHFVKAYQALTKASREALTLAGVPALAEARIAMLEAGGQA